MELINRFSQDPLQSFFLFGPRGTGKSTWLMEKIGDAIFIDLLAPEVFRELGADLIPIGVRPNGKNINRLCGATHPEAMARLVVRHQADLPVSIGKLVNYRRLTDFGTEGMGENTRSVCSEYLQLGSVNINIFPSPVPVQIRILEKMIPGKLSKVSLLNFPVKINEMHPP